MRVCINLSYNGCRKLHNGRFRLCLECRRKEAERLRNYYLKNRAELLDKQLMRDSTKRLARLVK